MNGEHDTDQADHYLWPLSHTTIIAAASTLVIPISNLRQISLQPSSSALDCFCQLRNISNLLVSLHCSPSKPPSVPNIPPCLVAIAMDCFGDFCLACDQQTNGSPFCSQACRLAELDHSLSSSEPASPVFEREGVSQRSSGLAGKGFHLPPAIDFLSYRRDRNSNRSQSTHNTTSTTEPRRAKVASTATTLSRPSNLTPSSSQTSLSSLHTDPASPGGISEQAWNELRDYASNFDQVRTLKRRMSTL